MNEICVIDTNGQFVAVVERDTYQLRTGERFIETAPPTLRYAVGYPGMVKPVWNGESWTEGATFPEIVRWDIEHMNTSALEKTLWDTMEDAYREGVNSAYDQ